MKVLRSQVLTIDEQVDRFPGHGVPVVVVVRAAPGGGVAPRGAPHHHGAAVAPHALAPRAPRAPATHAQRLPVLVPPHVAGVADVTLDARAGVRFHQKLALEFWYLVQQVQVILSDYQGKCFFYLLFYLLFIKCKCESPLPDLEHLLPPLPTIDIRVGIF